MQTATTGTGRRPEGGPFGCAAAGPGGRLGYRSGPSGFSPSWRVLSPSSGGPPRPPSRSQPHPRDSGRCILGILSVIRRKMIHRSPAHRMATAVCAASGPSRGSSARGRGSCNSFSDLRVPQDIEAAGFCRIHGLCARAARGTLSRIWPSRMSSPKARGRDHRQASGQATVANYDNLSTLLAVVGNDPKHHAH